jgi:RNA polymerase sigma-70 factor (ECF subfamily)
MNPMPRLLRGLGAKAPEPAPKRHDELAALANDAADGNAKALRTLLTTLTPQLLRVVRRVLGKDHPDLEDVTYEAAYAVLEGLPRFRGDSSVRHYACRVAALTAMNVRRRECTAKRSREREVVDPETFASEGFLPDQAAHHNSLVPIVRELVATLPDALAEALTLHVILGYTVNEIAESSETPVETVRSRLRLAKRSLRKRALGHPTLGEVMEVES